MTKTNRKTDTRRTPESRAVAAYLKVLPQLKGGAALARLERIKQRQAELSRMKKDTTDPLRRLKIVQEQIDLNNETVTAKRLANRHAKATVGFIQHAKAYGETNGISYSAWRRAGVPIEVLEEAGISKAQAGRKSKVSA